jgi:hypothetical protein
MFNHNEIHEKNTQINIYSKHEMIGNMTKKEQG